jgi:hypothetical protein
MQPIINGYLVLLRNERTQPGVIIGDKTLIMRLFILLFPFFLSTVLNAQDQNTFFDAIGSGDAARVVNLMDQSIELCFDDKVEFLSRPEARTALVSFFKKNPPLTFKPLHQGNSKGDSNYMIGEYRSQNSRKFRVYIFAKDKGSAKVIQELRFDIQK